MPAIVLVGAQWGDEGKGKVTDYLAGGAAAVVRYQGGNNAGHTVLVGEEKYKLHLIPSGILYRARICILGNGTVVDLPALVAELDDMARRGVDTSNLYVSSAAHLILPYHKVLDARAEESKGADQIGTTRRGIGPAYEDKVNRMGIRVGDLTSPERFARKLERVRVARERELAGSDLDWDRIADETLAAFARLAAHVTDTGEMINQLLDSGERVLFEGAQGTFLDLDHGTYPYVTSSTPTAGGACVGSGVGPTRIDRVIGVTKAYTTRVGSGPFPTELTGAAGEEICRVGEEYGTTTGRRRRCGWLDAVMLRHAVRVNGLASLAVTKLDVLDAFDTLSICSAYDLASAPEAGFQSVRPPAADGPEPSEMGARFARVGFPQDVPTLSAVVPRYEEHAGWRTSTKGIRDVEELPAAARRYLARIEELAGVPICLVSVGAERSTTIVLSDPWSDRRR
jgi:adenylosuccinate synthase